MYNPASPHSLTENFCIQKKHADLEIEVTYMKTE